MKRLALTFIAILSVCGRMAAQQVAVADVEAVPGETLSFTLQLDTRGGSYVGLEFDVQFPQGGFVTTGNAATLADWNGAFTIGGMGAVGISNLARCGVLSYSSTPIPGEGLLDLGLVEFKVADGVSLGDYTVTLTNMTLVGDVRVPVADATFKVSVVNAHDVLLDENATTAPKKVSPANVRVLRTLNADEWATICLPFAMTEEQVVEAFGEGVQVADFTAWSPEEDSEGNITGISLGFETVAAMEANRPYLIRVAEDVAEFTLDGVDISPEEEPTVQVGKRLAERGYFVGTHVVASVPEENLFLDGGVFAYSDGTMQTKAFSAYFELAAILTDMETAAGCVDIVLDGENITTGISAADAKRPTTSLWYNLQGQRLSQPRKGLNITGGRKVMVK